MPFTPSPRTPSFHQPPAAVWGSQVRHQSAADAGLVPGSAADGTRVTHGRPPCPVIAWGFGGRCVVMRPKMQGAMGDALAQITIIIARFPSPYGLGTSSNTFTASLHSSRLYKLGLCRRKRQINITLDSLFSDCCVGCLSAYCCHLFDMCQAKHAC